MLTKVQCINSKFISHLKIKDTKWQFHNTTQNTPMVFWEVVWNPLYGGEMSLMQETETAVNQYQAQPWSPRKNPVVTQNNQQCNDSHMNKEKTGK